jgi:hypothetical protein
MAKTPEPILTKVSIYTNYGDPILTVELINVEIDLETHHITGNKPDGKETHIAYGDRVVTLEEL